MTDIQPVLYVKGFISKSEAMRFEYAWKHSKPKANGKDARVARVIELVNVRNVKSMEFIKGLQTVESFNSPSLRVVSMLK